MKIIVAVTVAVFLSGCSTAYKYIPSFWDDNQSHRAIDIRQSIVQLDCSQPHRPQAQRIADNIQWFELYSESKGRSQHDVIKLIEPLKLTADDFLKRSSGEQQGSKVYCELKKRVMIEQSQRMAGSVLGRW
jgi:hypothetical protein